MAGLGTWQYNDTVAQAATTLALSLGYTHIDTAWVYKNAAGIGKALASSPRPRSSYFITSKIMGGNATTTLQQHKEVLHLLGTDYVDLLLVHFPGAYDPKTKGFVGSRSARQAQWKAMEDLVGAGAARSLGVSHYCKRHLQDVLDIARVKVAVNQVQYHGTASYSNTASLPIITHNLFTSTRSARPMHLCEQWAWARKAQMRRMT